MLEREVLLAGREHHDGLSDRDWLASRPHGNWAIRALGYGLRKTLRASCDAVTFDRRSFREAAAEVQPNERVLLLPTHRSYFDFLLTSYLLFQHPELGIAIPHIAAASEFGRLPAISKVLSAAHAFYIERGRGHADPQLNVQLSQLLDAGATLLFFVEGTRSRDRRFLPPKRGILRALQSTARSFRVLPIAISYDRLADERSLLRELGGGRRSRPSARSTGRWLATLARGRVQLGHVHLACGRPLSLTTGTDIHALTSALADEHRRATVITDFHLRAFIARHPRFELRWLQDLLEERGARVLASKLPVPSPCSDELLASLTQQWAHWLCPLDATSEDERVRALAARVHSTPTESHEPTTRRRERMPRASS